ncbi:hypothetical protein IMG5_103550 [Ichthyophthirius multifiliis]|uniref:Uncharacterized protein n=1 Tax=Ichthyophthirius multifiliis TaxID=5932 RepID=G0QSU4_ICHMU|nr:hypothetical protein IMG5_103550 [Ichthyophthirius multifiliis]EGR31711.1 hypothetical protein IMG5_103550 [Ichthyophthirius multifiliis]|eukprot:XP_004035197.1 hypothetical protein IMG5_103550 [Ichthyophthirius multifiliis]
MLQKQIRSTLIRGGTSKGLFFLESDLPKCPQERNHIFLRSLGSPDPYKNQIDGIGGATSSTSKIIIVNKSQYKGIDFEYTFGQVSINKNQIDFSGNCGNLSSAVPLFAVHSGLVQEKNLYKMYQKAIDQCIEAQIEDFKDYTYFIDGVAFGGLKVGLKFLKPGKSMCKEIFPSGNLIDFIDGVQVTLVDSGIPSVFVKNSDLNIFAGENKNFLNSQESLKQKLENIRCQASVLMGITQNIESAKLKQTYPKICVVSDSIDYIDSAGRDIKKENIDVLARYLSMGDFHHAIPITGAVALTTCLQFKDTVCGVLLGQDMGQGLLKLKEKFKIMIFNMLCFLEVVVLL